MTVNSSIFKAVAQHDIKLCLKVRKKVFCDEQKVGEDRDVDCYDEICDHWLAIDDSDPSNPIPVGTARLIQYNNQYGEKVGKVGRVAVLSSHRGWGIAKQLMLNLELFARNSPHFDKLLLHSQADKQGFYSKLGYKLIDPNEAPFDEEGILHVRMLKSLK